MSVLDLSPISSGSTAREALRNTLDLAARAEAFGYHRYWLAEHHLNPGLAGAAPHVLIAHIAEITKRIRVGTAATIVANYEPLQLAEAVGTVAALHPGRVDIGLGRSGSRPAAAAAAAGAGAGAADAARPSSPGSEADAGRPANRIVDGLVIPPPHGVIPDLDRAALQATLLGRTDADEARFPAVVDDIIAFFEGRFRDPHADESAPALSAHPAEGEDVEVWIHGSTAGPSARLAGSLGLPFGANYHVAPAHVLDAIAEYRAHFVAANDQDAAAHVRRHSRPYVIVSVELLVAETDEIAAQRAAGYAQWVHSIRKGLGTIRYPTPAEAARHPLDAAETAIVRDRVDTRFVGSATTVASQLETLVRVTGADELLVTTMTHSHSDRVRSYELLAEGWGIG